MLLILLALVLTASAQEISDKEAACAIVAAMYGKDPYYECGVGPNPDPARVAITNETVGSRLALHSLRQACREAASERRLRPDGACTISVLKDGEQLVTMDEVLERLDALKADLSLHPDLDMTPRLARVPRGSLTIMACARCKAIVGAKGRVTTGAETTVDAGMQEITIVTASGREDRFEVEVGEGARVVFMWSSTLMAPKVVGGEARRIK